jgi:excisionase family DNA binding protein
MARDLAGLTAASTPWPPRSRPRQAGVQAYTVEQVAEILHVGRDKVYCLLRTGQLRSIKIGKLRRITDQHLAEFIASHEEARWAEPDFPDREGRRMRR